MNNTTILKFIEEYANKKFNLDINLKCVTSWYCTPKLNQKFKYDINTSSTNGKINVACTITTNGLLSKLDLANPKTQVKISNIHFSNGYEYAHENREIL